MEEYVKIGKLNLDVLNKYFKVATDELIITKERINHINKRHQNDYDIYGKYILEIIEEPDYILQDIENKDTLLYLKSIKSLNLQVVVKIQTESSKNRVNSVITFWHMRKSSYNKIILKNKIIFKV